MSFTISSRCVWVLCLAGVWAACGGGEQGSQEADPLPSTAITATPGTALRHAQLCQQQLGRIPTWTCQDGVQIPIHVGGQVVTTTPDSCDNADLKGQCVVGSYVGHVGGQNVDGSPRPDVDWVFFCRHNDDFAQMIGHDKATGATCFFELKNGYMPLENGVPKGKVPGIDAPDYEAAWKNPDAITSQICNHCHTPDPFIHTPFVDGARRPDAPQRPVVPEVASPDSRYFVPGEAFASWRFDFVEFDDNACTSCHRMPDFRRFTNGSGVDFNAHMPPLAPGSMKADFDAVMACLNQGPDVAPGCRWAALNGATPATDPPTTPPKGSAFETKGTFATTYGSLGAADPFAAGSGTFAGGEISPYDVGSIAGPTGDAAGSVQIDVIGRQKFLSLPDGGYYIARFSLPPASFSAGSVIDLAGPVASPQLLFGGASMTMGAPLGPVTGGSLTLTKAGTQIGDAVEGSFVLLWQDGAK